MLQISSSHVFLRHANDHIIGDSYCLSCVLLLRLYDIVGRSSGKKQVSNRSPCKAIAGPSYIDRYNDMGWVKRYKVSS